MSAIIADNLRSKLPTATVPVALSIGSVKQLKWAESIRIRRLPEAPTEIVPYLNAVTDATWWIRNQNKDWENFNWDFLVRVSQATETKAGPPPPPASEAGGRTKLAWFTLNDRNHAALLFSWMTIQVFRHGIGGWRWSALGAISTGTFLNADDAKTCAEQFVKTQMTEALTRL